MLTEGRPMADACFDIKTHNAHVREMIARIHWLVRLRWGFAFVLGLLAVAAFSGLAPVPLDGRWFLFVTLMVLASNAFFLRRSRRLDAADTTEDALRRHCRGEILLDYAALAVVVHALGGLGTPALFFVIPNVIVAVLFFPRGQSLAVVLWGMALVASPVLLAAAGLIEPVTLFPGGGAARQPAHIAVWLSVYAVVVLFTWYLASHITERLVRNELELERNYCAILDLDAAKTRAVVQGTHELKAPLAAIRSYAWTLRDGYAGPLPGKAQEIVGRIGERCDRLLSKITDIVRLSNLRSYVRTEEGFVSVDLAAVMREAAEEARRNAAGRGIAIELDITADDPLSVRATREHLATLLDNLLTNAVNYSHDGGVVTMRLMRDSEGARIEVEDRGIGIPADALDRVFDEHFRARNAVLHSENGTGLGLPIVRTIARLLGAEIALDSEEGRGTKATLTIPLAA